MTYEQAEKYLKDINKFGINFGLERIKKLLALMHNPENSFKIVHVTGTNGKGSTSAMIASILQKAGIKTALYTSPHLSEYTERMMVNDQAISKEEFASVIEYASHFAMQMVQNGWEHPTEFEILTAAAFNYFAAKKVEYAVVEVGLGGLLDSTNVVIPKVSVITNVTLEHTDRCGKTLADIAHHKAGIIKQEVPVVTAAQGDALAVIKDTAFEKDAPLFVLGRDFKSKFIDRHGLQQNIEIKTVQHGDLGRFTVNLLGRHQAENSTVAVMAALVLAKSESSITMTAIREGLACVKWPGRFEVVNKRPLVVIDGAHNPDGARVLREALDDIFPGQKIIFLLGILADKDIIGITNTLVRSNDEAVVVQPLSPRAAHQEDVAGNLKANRVEIAKSIEEGYGKARTLACSNGVVCVTGSLYLVGPARELVYK